MTDDKTPDNAMRARMSEGEYHAHENISRSATEVFRKSRREYHSRYVAKDAPESEPSDQMLTGTLLHAMILEPDSVDARFVEAPKVDRRTKAGKAQWQKFQDASAGKIVLDGKLWDAARTMADSIWNHGPSQVLFSELSLTEQSLFWKDPYTELPLKCRIDAVHPNVLIDVKTARDPSPEGFARSCATFGYHRQAEWYARGWRELTGEDLHFLFLVVGNQFPYEVAIYELDGMAIDLARDQNREILEQLAECVEDDAWQSPWGMRVNELSLPRWAHYEEYQL